jgi:hypothetical protein
MTNLHKLAAVARGIGMRRCGNDPMTGEKSWSDKPDELTLWVKDADLRTYLLTGDRPLRILEALHKMGVRYRLESFSEAVICRALRDGCGVASVSAPTPAEAILACAEACS